MHPAERFADGFYEFMCNLDENIEGIDENVARERVEGLRLHRRFSVYGVIGGGGMENVEASLEGFGKPGLGAFL